MMSRGTAMAVPFKVWANGRLVDAGERGARDEERGAGRWRMCSRRA